MNSHPQRKSGGKHICVIYDCLFPWTVGGAERWYRHLAERYAIDGHRVTYLTMQQWEQGEEPQLPGVEIIAVAPRMALYADGKRRILPPLTFGLGVFMHLLGNGRRYDLVHTASFPFFSLLAAGLLRPLLRFRLAVDWHEAWSRSYWREYLGAVGLIGWVVQRTCARLRHTAFSFSRMHAGRVAEIANRDVTILTGEYAGPSLDRGEPAQVPPHVVYAGRMIPEKRVPLLVEALALAMERNPALRARLIGRGPDLQLVEARIRELGLADRIETPGFVDDVQLEQAMRSATAIVQPSSREGYGMVVVEASARGVPCIVVPGEDNAAVELVEQGRNGIVATAASETALAEAIGAVVDGGDRLRAATSQWYADNAVRLSFEGSFQVIRQRLGLD
ncbi:MAG: glycosyltransferase family 4 protein [Brevundimonas sp.]|nr:glycosyltransferase family 4 protein [Brevundimonas sp.]